MATNRIHVDRRFTMNDPGDEPNIAGRPQLIRGNRQLLYGGMKGLSPVTIQFARPADGVAMRALLAAQRADDCVAQPDRRPQPALPPLRHQLVHALHDFLDGDAEFAGFGEECIDILQSDEILKLVTIQGEQCPVCFRRRENGADPVDRSTGASPTR